VPTERVICAHPVHERGFGFQGCTRETPTRVAGRIKHKGSCSRQSIRLQPGKGRQFDYGFASDLVDVGLDARRGAAEIELRVAVVTVVRLGREPTIEVVAVANQESARLAAILEYAVADGVLCEKSRALDANF
jgi:hypothetical protein